MKIRNQPLHGVKAVTGRDKEPGIGTARLQAAALRGRFQRPQAGGAHRHHGPPCRLGGAHGFDGGLWDVVPLAVHRVLA